MVFLVLLGVFGATVALCIGTWAYLYRGSFAASTRIPAERDDLPGGDGQRTPGLLRDMTVSDLKSVDRLLSGTSLSAIVASELRGAGSSAKPDAFLLALGIGGAAGALLGTILGQWLAFPLAFLGLAIPCVWLEQRRRRRRSALEDQLPEALVTLVAAMRAGYSFQRAVKLVGEETSAPLGPELLQVYKEQLFGIETRVALLGLQDRCRTADMKTFVTAVLVHGEAGGSLPDVLSDVAGMLRRRAETTQRITALAAESRLAARVLTVIPLLAFGSLVAGRPDMDRVDAPPIGWLVVVYATLSITLGYLILMRIARVER